MKSDKVGAAIWIRLAKCYGLVLREIRKRQAGSGLTLPQFDALGQLHRHPQGMTAGELSRALLVTAGNVTGIVSRLRARGLVERAAHPSDGRVSVLRLTPEGVRITRREMARQERQLDEILAALPPPEAERVVEALDAMRRAVEPGE